MTPADDLCAPRANILLVDDQPANLLALEAILQDLEQNLVTVRSGEDALRCILQQDFAVVLLDVQMQGLDGLETAQLIRGRKKSRHTPIIFLTAYESPDARVIQAYALGAVDFLIKPLVPEILRSKVAVFVELFQKAEQVKRQGEQLRQLQQKEFDRQLAEERQQREIERYQLEAQMQHAQKLESLGVLAGGIAHDFNNLLTGVLGNASLALMELPPESPVCATIQQIETAAQRAADLTQQLLAYSGKGRFVVQPVNLSREVEEMAALLQTAKSRRAALRFEFAADLPAIDADPTQVRQVIMNLITNASEAIGDAGGTITVRTGISQADQSFLASTGATGLEEGHYAYVEVSDTGCGMDGETQARIFDPFFTTKFTGRGLGLAAVLGIVRGHRGTIRVHSAPGQGTTFQVFFPCNDLSRRAATEGPPLQDPWWGSGTILVVDDEPTVRTVAQHALEAAGFHTLLAEDGPRALDLFRQHGPEISAVLLDLTMPEMNGAEVFRELHHHCPEIPVLLTSGYSEQEVAGRFAGQAPAGFVQKPFGPSELLAAFRRVLGKGPARGWPGPEDVCSTRLLLPPTATAEAGRSLTH